MRRVGYPPVREIQLTTERKTQLLDITSGVREALGSEAQGSAALVYVPHTTAGVVINEKIDPDLLDDFEMALQGMVDDGWSWKHVDADGPNAPSHVRASVVGPQVLVPLKDGELALGTYQGIFFCEFDGPRTRKVLVTSLV
jgi:secondary thiamine-phosphate synthase enzyme